MAKKRRAMALVVVLMVSFVVLIFAFTGVQFTSQNLFTVARAEARNQAFYAAQAGIYATVHNLERSGTPPSAGSLDAVTLDNGASYQVDIAEIDRNRFMYRLTSRGSMGGTRRTLQVDIGLGADSFQAMTSEGRIGISQDTFINGIESTKNPRPARGNLHTNSADNQALYSSGSDRVSVTGKATAVGGIGSSVVIGTANPHADSIPPLSINRSSLLAGSFTTLDPASIPADGRISGNVKIDGNFDRTGPLIVPEGSTLHVTGKMALSQSATGGGTIVVDGDTLIRGADKLDLQNGKGVLLYASGAVSLVHPEATQTTQSVTQVYGQDDTSQETYTFTTTRLATYFAERPPDTEFELRQNLPIEAPTTTREFFDYYRTQQLSPSEAFQAWKDGDPSVTFTGLSPATKAWLNKAQSDPVLHQEIQALSQ